MITAAAVKILLKEENREVIIPCHRHPHAYRILKDLGFQPSDFQTIEQGFIVYEVDPENRYRGTEKFLGREDAWDYAIECGQIEGLHIKGMKLTSEDLW